MTQKLKLCLSLFVTVCLLSLLASVALAEPADPTQPGGPENSTESSADSSAGSSTDPSNDPGSSEPSDDPSDEPSSEPSTDPSTDPSDDPGVQTRTVTIAGNTEGVRVFFAGAADPATQYTATVGETVSFRVTVLEGYQLEAVKLFGVSLAPADGVYSFEISADVNAYTVQITAKATGVQPPDPPVNTAPLQITLHGAGEVTIGEKVISCTGDSTTSETVQLTIGEPTKIQVAAAHGYRLTGMKLDGATHSLQNLLTLTITELTTLELTFSPETVAPTTYQVLVSCNTEGGYVTAGAYSITSGNTQTINVQAGGSLTITVHPQDGYEIDSFTVGGTAQNLSGGSYVLQNVAASTTVSVSFKATTSTVTVAQASDFSWTANDQREILLDLTGYSYIGKSVFDKINTLTAADGTYVVLKTTYICWYVPCGSQITDVPAESLHLVVSLNANGSYFSTIDASIRAQDPDTIFNYYELAETPTFPEGTKAAFQLAELAGTYTGNGTDLMVRSDRSLVTCGNGTAQADGWTTPMTYQTSRNLVVRIAVADQYTITAAAGNGGKCDPSGTNSVTRNGNCTFAVTADTGYIIAAVYVDDVAVSGAAGTGSFRYAFENVTGNHAIRAEFIPADSNYRIENNIAKIQADTPAEPTRSYTGLIVALVIIVLAVAGAAALFIVKWRQEQL